MIECKFLRSFVLTYNSPFFHSYQLIKSVKIDKKECTYINIHTLSNSTSSTHRSRAHLPLYFHILWPNDIIIWSQNGCNGITTWSVRSLLFVIRLELSLITKLPNIHPEIIFPVVLTVLIGYSQLPRRLQQKYQYTHHWTQCST